MNLAMGVIMHQSRTTERVLCCHIFYQIHPYTQCQTYRQPLPSQEFQSFHAFLYNVFFRIVCPLKFKKSNKMRKAFIYTIKPILSIKS